MEQEERVTDLKWEGLMALFNITVQTNSRPDFLVKHLDIFTEKQQNIQTNLPSSDQKED